MATAPTFAGLEDLTEIWAPPEKLSLSAWAEKHFYLSPEYSAKTNLLVLEPGQKEIFDAFTDPAVESIALMVATQMTKTIFLQVCAAYTIAEDPGPILIVSYKDSDAEKLSKERFTPMIRDIPKLRARVSPAKSRDANNTIDHKVFPGGTLDFVGSLSPANLARRTIRVLLMDEIDKYDVSAGHEGDPLDLAERRTVRYGSRRKIAWTCSPTIRGRSRIAFAYDGSDQRKPYISCHKCGKAQLLLWTQVKFNSKLAPAIAARGARYECIECGALWTDADRRRNIMETWEWRAHAPFSKRAGFNMGHLHSTLPLHSMAELATKFLEAKGKPENLKVFVNTDLAELWEDEGERPEYEKVMGHAEDFEVGPNAMVPFEASCLTAGVDVQAKRLEIQVLAHGPGKDGALQIWTLDYQVIELVESSGQGKMTSAPEYWTELLRLLDRTYVHASGVEIPIIAMSVDVGYNPEPVYTFARGYPQPTYSPQGLHLHSPRTVLCVRGMDSEQLNAIHRVTERETARQRKGPGADLQIITLGTGYLKQDLYSKLLGRADEKRIHLSRRLTEEYFRGLVAEKRVVSSKGAVEWQKVYPRNEPLDTWVYAMGAFAAFQADKFSPVQWAKLRKQLGLPEVPDDGSPKPPKRALRPRVIPSPYLS